MRLEPFIQTIKHIMETGEMAKQPVQKGAFVMIKHGEHAGEIGEVVDVSPKTGFVIIQLLKHQGQTRRVMEHQANVHVTSKPLFE